MKTAEWHQQGRSGDFIVRLKKEYTFLPFYVWIREFRMGGYFLKSCFINTQFKKSSQRTLVNFHGNRLPNSYQTASRVRHTEFQIPPQRFAYEMIW